MEPSNPDTIGPQEIVLISEVSLFQVHKTQTWYLGRKEVSCLERCPHFRGVLIEGFHCICIGHTRRGRIKCAQCHVCGLSAAGCVNVVCSDKTGTLTENCMEVTSLYTASHRHVSVGKSGAVCEGSEVTPTTHPDVIKVIEVSKCVSNLMLHV